MLKVSDAFNSAFAAPDRELRARVTIGKTVYDSDDLTSINYDSGAMTGEQFSIGSTYMNSTKITFSHLVEGLKQLDEVLLEFGIVKADGSTEYVKMGTFIIDDKIQMDRNNNSTTIECMDRMVMLGGAYKSKLSYPATIKSVAVEIANMAGVRVNDTSFARLPNQSINEPIGYSYRDAIGIIAQFAMGFALFDRAGYLDIRTLVDSEFKIDPNQYFLKGLVKNETFFKLNGISCTVVTTSKDENGNETSKTTVLQSGSSSGSQIKLANNVMTQDVLDRMYESLKFTNYYPFTLNWNGNPAVEAGDWLTLEDMQGNEFKVPNMSFTLTFNGGLTASSKAETSTNSSVTYSYGGSMSNIVNEIGGREGAEGNHIYEGTEDQEPALPKEGDLWYKHVGPDTEEWIYKDGKWEFLTSTKPATDAQKAADQASKEAGEAKTQANKAVDGANDAVAKAGFANDTATQAKSDAAEAGQSATTALTNAGTALTNAKNALDNVTKLDQTVKTEVTNINGQLAQKVSQTTFDTLKGTVTSQGTLINQNKDAIKLKADQTYVDTIKGTVENNNAAIDLNSKEIKLKASQSDVDKLGGRVTDAEAQIELQADQIKLTVSKTELTNVLGDYATQTWTQSQIKSTADQIKLSVSEVQSNLDNLSSGGRNYIKGSDVPIHITGVWHTESNGIVVPSWYAWIPTLIGTASGDWVVSFNIEGLEGHNPTSVTVGFADPKSTANNRAMGDFAVSKTGRVVAKVNLDAIDNSWTSVLIYSNSGQWGGSQNKKANISHYQIEKGNVTGDWKQAPEDMATEAQFSQLQLTVNGIQGTVQNKADKSQVTQLANQITSTVTDLSAYNLITNTEFEDRTLNGWEFANPSLWSVGWNNSDVYMGSNALHFHRASTQTSIGWTNAGSNWIEVYAGQVVSASAVMYQTGPEGDGWTPTGLFTIEIDFYKDKTSGRMEFYGSNVFDIKSPYVKQQLKVENIKVPEGANYARFHVQTNGTGNILIAHPMLVKRATADTYVSGAVSQSQITQLSNDINLRVEKDKVVNQINISPEGILIDGKKVHITGQTRIDNAVIKDAMIADIKADKITAGTLNAANVNVINLNANNITTGTIKGANLSMNLNTGEVLFQKGAIRSTNGNLNIHIDDGSMSLTNSLGNGAYFKDGNIYMTDSDFWTPGNPKIQYGTLKMVPNFLSDAGGGVALKGPNGVVVGTDEYSDTGILGDLLSSTSGGGITLTKKHIRMASEGDIGIAGGKMYNAGFVGELPAIQVGIAGSYTAPMPWFPSGETGDALFLSGKVVGVVASRGTGNLMTNTISDLSASCDAQSGYVLSAATYKRTYGSGDTVTITPNGVFGRISSASKYKLAIGEISTLTNEAHQFLSVKPKQWFDKSESEALADSMTTGNTDYVDDAKALPHNGFIAEDLYTAGLDSYVIRGNDGSIESIQYDRLPVLHHELIRELFNRLDAAEMEIYKLKQEVLNNAN